MKNKPIAWLLITTLCFPVPATVNADEWICGQDKNLDGYTDAEDETDDCALDDFNRALCPMQVDSCTEKPVAEITKTQCQAHGEWPGATWWDKNPNYELVVTKYVKITSGEITGIRSGTVKKEGSVFWTGGPQLCGEIPAVPYKPAIPGHPGNPDADPPVPATPDIPEQKYKPAIPLYKFAVGRDFPNNWMTYTDLGESGQAQIRVLSSDYTESSCSYQKGSQPGAIGSGSYQNFNAKSAFSFRPDGIPSEEHLPKTAILKSSEYSIKPIAQGTGADGVYVRARWILDVPQVCEFDDDRTTFWESPWGEPFVCNRMDGEYLSSPNRCVDIENTPPIDHELSGDMITNDGDRDGEGNCLDEMQLYVGRAQSCSKPGVVTAWQDCCDYDGEIVNENVGSLADVGNLISTVQNLYEISKAAYVAYSAAASSGATAAAAASAAGSAASAQAQALYNPTTVAIGVAVYLVMEWIANACDQQDLETAASKAMGHCVEVGEYCARKWPFVGCVQRDKSFCCFNGKMQRIFHEQGRPQLKTLNNFGTPEAPVCRGFTPEEFQSLDFSKIDLSEYYEELTTNSATTIQQNIQQRSQNFYDSINN